MSAEGTYADFCKQIAQNPILAGNILQKLDLLDTSIQHLGNIHIFPATYHHESNTLLPPLNCYKILRTAMLVTWRLSLHQLPWNADKKRRINIKGYYHWVVRSFFTHVITRVNIHHNSKPHGACGFIHMAAVKCSKT